MKPTPYKFPDNDNILIWDLPGGGTKKFPQETYIRTMGLRYFDCVLLVSAERFLEVEANIMKNLTHFKVPHYPIRNKVDMAILGNKRRKISAEDTITEIRRDMEQRLNGRRVYLISAYDLDTEDLDGRILYDDIMERIRNDRIKSDHVEDREN